MSAGTASLGGAALAEASRIYLHPLGLVAGDDAAVLCARGRARPLAGGATAFTAVRLSWRGGDGAIHHRLVPCDGLDEAIAAAGAEAGERLRRSLRQLSRSRPSLAGVALDRPRVMGVLNVTPDSFSDGGRFLDPAAAIAHGEALYRAGADFIDIGAVSTRPGAEPVTTAVELARVLPVIRGLAALPVLLSVDTSSPETMRAAVAAGAAIINDVSALGADPGSLDAARDLGAAVILMHCQGEPRTMQRAPSYADPVLDIYDYLEERLAACRAHGIAAEGLLIDPGIGFGKTVAHNVDILGRLATFHGLGAGLVVGVSRKSFIGALDAGAPVERRLAGSLAAAMWALAAGAQVLRVHDVAETRQAIAVWRALSSAAKPADSPRGP